MSIPLPPPWALTVSGKWAPGWNIKRIREKEREKMYIYKKIFPINISITALNIGI